MANFITYYDNLNVSRNAPLTVIRAAYKALSQSYHPDKYTGGNDEALRIIKVINSAYAVLSDTHKRAEYDQWLAEQEQQHAAYQAHRIMNVFNQAYIEPLKVEQNKPSTSFFAALKKFRMNVNTLLKKRGVFIKTHLVKKKDWLISLFIMFSVVYSVNLNDRVDEETRKAAILWLTQDVTKILSIASQLVKQGQAVKALPLYLQLAEQGNGQAQFEAGLLYINEPGIDKDNKLAADWFTKAANQGLKAAQTKLGFMYATGEGVIQNYNTAVYWCYKAAEQGDIIAQYHLGVMYLKGQGVAKDNRLAVKWFSKAAEQGHAQAQYNLGVIYEKGMDVLKDKKRAADLYRKSANQGVAEAVAALEKLKNRE